MGVSSSRRRGEAWRGVVEAWRGVEAVVSSGLEGLYLIVAACSW